MDKLRNRETGQNLSFVRIVAGKDFTRYDTDMNGAGIVAYTEYFYLGKTSSESGSDRIIPVSFANIYEQLSPRRKQQYHPAEISSHPEVQYDTLLLLPDRSTASLCRYAH